MKLSVIIPCLREYRNLKRVVEKLHAVLSRHYIGHEIIAVLGHNETSNPYGISSRERLAWNLHYTNRYPTDTIGDAVRCGIDSAFGDLITIYMADGSDSPVDLVRMVSTMQDYDHMMFGSRFRGLRRPPGYPFGKWLLNRIGNIAIMLLIRAKCNDLTNAFKLYRRDALESTLRLSAQRYDISLEIALKAIKNGYRYVTIPVSWQPRSHGKSKFHTFRESWGFIKTFRRWGI